MIIREVGKGLEQMELDKDTFRLDGDAFSCMIKRNDSEYLSLLIEGSGMGMDAAHPFTWADTVNIDCSKERVVTQTDLLPEDEQE